MRCTCKLYDGSSSPPSLPARRLYLYFPHCIYLFLSFILSFSQTFLPYRHTSTQTMFAIFFSSSTALLTHYSTTCSVGFSSLSGISSHTRNPLQFVYVLVIRGISLARLVHYNRLCRAALSAVKFVGFQGNLCICIYIYR